MAEWKTYKRDREIANKCVWKASNKLLYCFLRTGILSFKKVCVISIQILRCRLKAAFRFYNEIVHRRRDDSNGSSIFHDDAPTIPITCTDLRVSLIRGEWHVRETLNVNLFRKRLFMRRGLRRCLILEVFFHWYAASVWNFNRRIKFNYFHSRDLFSISSLLIDHIFIYVKDITFVHIFNKNCVNFWHKIMSHVSNVYFLNSLY